MCVHRTICRHRKKSQRLGTVGQTGVEIEDDSSGTSVYKSYGEN